MKTVTWLISITISKNKMWFSRVYIYKTGMIVLRNKRRKNFKKEDHQCGLNNENTTKIIEENWSLNVRQIINSKPKEIHSNIMKSSRESISKMIM